MQATNRRAPHLLCTTVAASLTLVVAMTGSAEATPGTVRTAAGCRTRIGRLPKRRRCIACVRRGGLFEKRGAAAGFCRAGAKRRQRAAAAVAVAAADAVRTPAGCRSRIGRLPKRKRCLACVKTGRVFHKRGAGAGRCRARPGAGAAAAAVVIDTVRTPAGCRARVLRLPKRRRCLACVKTGRVFQKRRGGIGFCRRPGAAPAAAVVAADAVRTPAGCRRRVGRPAKRKRCLACVAGGGAFQKRGAGAGFCRARPGRPGGARPGRARPAAAGAVKTAAGCRARIGRLPKRRRCIACVRRGHTFFKQGAKPGLCR